MAAYPNSWPGNRPARQYADPRTEITGLILTCAVGVAGAVGGGRLAGNLFRVCTLHGFSPSTRLPAVAGAAVLLVFDLFTMRGHAGSGRRTSWANRCPGGADGVNSPVGAARAPSNILAADWLRRSRAASLLWLSPAACAGRVP